MSRSGSRSRQLLAFALTPCFVLLLFSPLWHHDHGPLGSGVAHDGSGPDGRLHVRGLATSISHPAGACPICLTQRMLGHGWIHVDADPIGLAAGSLRPRDSSVLPAAIRAYPFEARGPPLC